MDESITLSPEFERLLDLFRGESAGDPAAQCELAVLRLKTETPENRRRAFVQFRNLAHGEYTTSQTNARFMLGVCYENGFGVSKSYQSAIRWYRKAVGNIYRNDLTKNPDPVSERGIQRLTELTEGRDFDEALDEILFDETSDESVGCVTESAEAGDAEAQEYLMELYDLGTRDVPEDKEEALYWAQKAAENGSTKAMEYVADRYYNGFHVEKNVALGLYWHEKASQSGSNVAPGTIARYLEAQKRHKEAAAWYRLYAERQIKYRDWRLGWDKNQNAVHTKRKTSYSVNQLNQKDEYNFYGFLTDALRFDSQKAITASGTFEGGALIAFSRRGNKGLSAEGLTYFVQRFGNRWAIGRFFHASQYGDGGLVFDDKSLCVNLSVASAEEALQTAEKLCRRFNLTGVLLKFCDTDELYIIRRQGEGSESVG